MVPTATPANLIETHALGKHYPAFTLSDINLTVAPGEIVGFIGMNGAGKTTTIKCILGLTPYDSGASNLLGEESFSTSTGPAARVKEDVGVVFDTVAISTESRLSDIDRTFGIAYRNWDSDRFLSYIDRFGLSTMKNVGSLSRGMGMKLSLACALSHHACLLVLDEATAGLDPIVRDEILDILRDFVADSERGILMSSHITTDLERIADRIVCIHEGRIVFDLPKDQITDVQGIARCRAADLDRITAASIISAGQLRYLAHDYGIDVLVPDRQTFTQTVPDIPCDRMSIDDYLALILKGGVR